MKAIKYSMRAQMTSKLSKRINETLTLHGYKLYELADLLEVSPITISSWKTGKTAPRHWDTYQRVMVEMGDINKALRDQLIASAEPSQGDFFKTEDYAKTNVVVSKPTLGVRETPNEVPVIEDTITGIANDVMARAVDMLNALTGGPSLTVKQGHAFLDLLKMVEGQS
jgi:hypothetical protein